MARIFRNKYRQKPSSWAFPRVVFFIATQVALTGNAFAQGMTISGDSVGQVSADLSAQETAFGNKCREVRAVPVMVTEPFESYMNISDARVKAVKRARGLAINGVIGQFFQTSSQSRLVAESNTQEDFFVKISSSSFGGYVKYVLKKETALASVLNDRKIHLLKLELNFTVCIPKSDAKLESDRVEALQKARPPRRITERQPMFFDPATGTPRVWFWKSPAGDILIFDNAGFNPSSGDALQPITKEIAQEFLAVQTQQQTAVDEKVRGAAQCDQFAANPEDTQKPKNILGVPYKILSHNAKAAIRACALALEMQPSNPRFSYQLGRAWQTRNVAKAVPFLTRAVNVRYKAAFDNLGWVLLRSGKSDAAMTMFSRGASLGDPSSMFSLAMIFEEKPDAWSQNQAITYYQRAANLGHAGAARRLDQIEQDIADAAQKKAAEAAQVRAKQQQNAAATQLFLGLMGAVIQNQRNHY